MPGHTHLQTHTRKYYTCIRLSVANSEFGVSLVCLRGRAGGWGSSCSSVFFILASKSQHDCVSFCAIGTSLPKSSIIWDSSATSLSCSEWNACADTNIPSLVWRFWMLARRASSWPLKLQSSGLTSCCGVAWAPSLESTDIGSSAARVMCVQTWMA